MWFIVLIVLAVCLPPVAAFFVIGLSTHFWINLILTLPARVSGMVPALWLVVGRPVEAAGVLVLQRWLRAGMDVSAWWARQIRTRN